MAMRLYPDFVAAIEARDSIVLNTYLREKTDYDVLDKETVKDILKDALVSVSRCIYNQEGYRNNGVSNVFVGYGHESWNIKDYRDYFASLPQYFIKHPKLPDVYKLNVDNIEILDTTHKTMQNFCLNIMTVGAYSPMILRKYGFRDLK